MGTAAGNGHPFAQQRLAGGPEHVLAQPPDPARFSAVFGQSRQEPDLVIVLFEIFANRGGTDGCIPCIMGAVDQGHARCTGREHLHFAIGLPGRGGSLLERLRLLAKCKSYRSSLRVEHPVNEPLHICASVAKFFGLLSDVSRLPSRTLSLFL